MRQVSLHLGDCLQILPTLPDASVEAVFADPPYNLGMDYGGYYHDKLNYQDYMDWCASWFAECRRIARSAVVITPGMVNLPMWMYIMPTHRIVIWVKSNQMARNYIGKKIRGFFCWEPILFYGYAKVGYLRDVWDVPIGVQSRANGHPCPKPLRLMECLIPGIAEAGDVVLDPFMGSGTTGIACVRLGIGFIGIEINPDYFAMASRHIENELNSYGQAALDLAEATAS